MRVRLLVRGRAAQAAPLPAWLTHRRSVSLGVRYFAATMLGADPLLVISSLFLAAVVWLIARAVRQNGVLVRVAASPAPAGAILPSVTVVVPARNEAGNIGACLRSLLAQQYPTERLRIVVVDDDSEDDTAAIVAALAADSRITLLSAPALPSGWKGKAHACWYATQAVPADTEWLCFLDADMRAHPLALASGQSAWSSRLHPTAGRGLGWPLAWRESRSHSPRSPG